MTRLLLVRHGQSEWNAQGRWQGQADPPLSDTGREEARLAAATLKRFDGLFFASTLLRARQTAEIVSEEVGGRSVMLEPDMREIDVGDFSGLDNDEIQARFPEAWAALRAGELQTFPGGEDRAHFLERVLAALRGITSRHPDDEVFVATHGGAIGAVERHLEVHPGVGVRNLESRWFVIDRDGFRVESGRIDLLNRQSS
ncbi:MAG: histidine phosphatase family protein [Actinomycetota bacterium]